MTISSFINQFGRNSLLFDGNNTREIVLSHGFEGEFKGTHTEGEVQKARDWIPWAA